MEPLFFSQMSFFVCAFFMGEGMYLVRVIPSSDVLGIEYAHEYKSQRAVEMAVHYYELWTGEKNTRPIETMHKKFVIDDSMKQISIPLKNMKDVH